MAYAGIQMFMEKLNQLTNSNDVPFFNIPEIIYEKPQLQLLYQDLGSMIQTLFVDQHQDLHDPEKVNDLKQRFICAAEEAQYIVDLFLSRVHMWKYGHTPTSGDFNRSLNLDDVRRTFKSVQLEFMSINTNSKMMDSSPRPKTTLNQSDTVAVAAQSSISRGSMILMDQIFVGFDGDAELLIDKLVEYQSKLDVVSIVGIGGIGKTTLATKVFNDACVKCHFEVRVWVTVSHKYDKRAVLTQILESIGVQLEFEHAGDSKLREMVYKHLMDRRYLIVIDDIWDIETWDNLKLFLPHNNNGSRILLTSRLTEVANHANSDGFIHRLGYLNKDRGWELLCHRVFHGTECPEWSIEPGKRIVENCKGLPLALVVIAQVLARDALTKELWERVADKTGLYLVGDQNGYLETLNSSYNHLPLYLRECFLYLGGFPEDYEFQAQRLILLWVAEGFIQEDGNRSLEDIAEGYLLELIDRNLVIVAHRSSSSGTVKVCKLHDFVRELCLKKAVSSHVSNITARPYKVARLFIHDDSHILGFPNALCPNLQSILCVTDFTTLRDDIAKYFCSFVLLRVLDLQKCRLNDVPEGMELLVHLRYLAIWNSSAFCPPSICNLWSLQTLIYITERKVVVLPSNISDLVNLRHLWSYFPPGNAMKVRKPSMPLFLLSNGKLMNLQTISNVELGKVIDDFQKWFPHVKKLGFVTSLDEEYDFKSLTYLEKLKLTGTLRRTDRITFPATLKSLTLVGCGLMWSDMSIIQSLPKLQSLKLHNQSFEGSCWNTYGQEFPQLKFLRLQNIDIKEWEAYSKSFPRLRQLEIIDCRDLEEIPLAIEEISTLELIRIINCRHSLRESVRRIKDDFGDDLKIDILYER